MTQTRASMPHPYLMHKEYHRREQKLIRAMVKETWGETVL